MSKHTPGPWKVGSTEGGWTCVYPEDHPNLAICNLVENNEANALLIAAAPYMLKVLMDIADAFSWPPNPQVQGCSVIAKTAVKLATGTDSWR